MRVLAVDPSLRSSGFAVVETAGRGFRAVEFGVIKNKPALLPSGCLVAIRERLADLIQQHQPDAAVVEGIIFVQSHRIAITMGAARAAAIIAFAERGLPVYEYAPRRVKQAVTGRGTAGKNQVGFMVRVMLGLTENPPPDAADAIAIALTYLQAQNAVAQGVNAPERI